MYTYDKEVIKTKDYIIEDLFTDLGKVGSELDKFKVKCEEKNAVTPNKICEKISQSHNATSLEMKLIY